MINTFEELNAKLKAENWSLSIDDVLTGKDAIMLIAIVQQWPEEKFKNVQDMFSDYYGLSNIDCKILREICIKDLDLAFEVHTDGVRDTCVRDRIGGALMKYIGCPAWPTYGDVQEYTQTFYVLLKQQCAKFNIVNE